MSSRLEESRRQHHGFPRGKITLELLSLLFNPHTTNTHKQQHEVNRTGNSPSRILRQHLFLFLISFLFLTLISFFFPFSSWHTRQPFPCLRLTQTKDATHMASQSTSPFPPILLLHLLPPLNLALAIAIIPPLLRFSHSLTFFLREFLTNTLSLSLSRLPQPMLL